MPCEVRSSMAPRQAREAAIREENVTNWVTLFFCFVFVIDTFVVVVVRRKINFSNKQGFIPLFGNDGTV